MHRIHVCAALLIGVLVASSAAWAFSGASSSRWYSVSGLTNNTHTNFPLWPTMSDSSAGYLQAAWDSPPLGEQSAAITINGAVTLEHNTSPYALASGTVTFALFWYDCQNVVHYGPLHHVWVNSAGHGQISFTDVVHNWCPQQATTTVVRVKWEAQAGYQAVLDNNDLFTMTWVSN